jgi:multiple sugar transport system permease protein
MLSHDRKNGLKRSFYHLLLWAISILFFSPIIWMIICSMKTREQILTIPPKWLFVPTLKNYIGLFDMFNFSKELMNSIFMSLSAVVIAVVVSFLAAYSFSRFKPKGTDLIMFILLSMRMVPAAAVVVPIYLLYAASGWKGTYPGMILFYAMFSIPFSVWILKGFIDGVSERFDETALANGGSRMHIIFRLVMPQVKPGLIAAFIFNIIFVWNEFLFNYIIGGKKTATVPVGLAQGFTVGGGIQWDFIATLTTFYSVPLIIFIFFFQKYLLVGMTFGTVRGEV